MKKSRINSDDEILKLPEYLVHDILSCLPFKDAVRTCILSKRWQNLWIAALTNLYFSYGFFKLETYGMKSEEEINAKREHLLDFMERTLRSCHTQMVRLENLFIIVLFKHSKFATSLDRCISLGIECNLSHLSLVTNELEDFYDLPRIVFAAKKLTYLNLCGWKLEYSSCLNMNFCCLIRLFLSRVSVDEKMIQNLIANCPVIKYLFLEFCRGSKGTLNISGLVNPNLTRMHLSYCEFERVEIEALGFQDFEFKEGWKPCEISVSTCKNMRTLRLTSATITDKWLHDHLSNFRHLEWLLLENCDMVETIKISSYRLKILELSRCRNLVKVEIDDPNLRLFTYTGQNVLLSFSSNALALEIADISFYPDNVNALWYAKLTGFIGNFNNSEVLKLRSESDKFVKNCIVPKELRESLPTPLFNVKHFILELEGELLTQDVEEIVDGLLWFSPHPVCIKIETDTMEKTLCFKFIYKEMDKDGNPCCCSSLPLITCWRRCIKEVKIESSGWAEEDERNIKSFFEHTNF